MTAEGRKVPKDREETEEAGKAMDWVLERLTVLEYLILFLAMVLALLGGALVAWLVSTSSSLSFRWTWAVTSLLMFILPGAFVYLRELRSRSRAPADNRKSEPKGNHG
jgi:hypothetical protein